MRLAEQQRLPTAAGRIAKAIRAHVAYLDRHLDRLDADLDRWRGAGPLIPSRASRRGNTHGC